MEVQEKVSNPLAGLVSEDIYHVLSEHNLLNDKRVRDYHMRKQFRKMREKDIPANEAIERLREKHAYLQFDTIRKIVYKLN